jgi:hypothetical protein
MITFACPSCHKHLQIAPEHAGNQIHCPGCAQPVPVPQQGPAGADVLDPVPPCPGLEAVIQPASPVAEPPTGPPTPPTALADTVPGYDNLPGYEILGELGRGGMGVVYRARQVGLNRVVALKMILHGPHAGADDLARFRTEAEAIARLRHPNIVTVYEIGEHQGKPFFSQEFCSGGSLDRQLAGTPIKPEFAARLVRTLAEAMHAAHQANVIHRDLKPANVLLGADGSPRITDFGLARKLDQAGQTLTGAVMGTPSYMAPAQAEGKKQVGPLADVYALGAILYECLVGRPPFKAATPLDTILQVVSEEPVAPRQLNAGVPLDLETICLKCLCKEPQRRYSSAQALADDLKRWQRHEPISARAVGSLERGVRWTRRNPVVAGLIAALAFVLVGGFAVGFWQWLRAERQRIVATQERDLARARETTARRYLYGAQMNLTLRAWQDAQITRAIDLLGAQVPEEGQEDLRGPEWYY